VCGGGGGGGAAGCNAGGNLWALIVRKAYFKPRNLETTKRCVGYESVNGDKNMIIIFTIDRLSRS
jgi:hypothetical protein